MRGMTVSLIAGASILAAGPSMAQSDWRQVAYDSGLNVAFFYSPSSVQRNGGYATVKWHDSRNPGLVFLVQADCSARTLLTLSADEFDANGGLKQHVDLTGRSTPQQVGPAGTFGYNLVQAVC